MTVFLLIENEWESQEVWSVNASLEGAKAEATQRRSGFESMEWAEESVYGGHEWWPRMGTCLVREWLPGFGAYDQAEKISSPCYIEEREVQP